MCSSDLWFHPQTELTAEKHQAFTVPGPDGTPIDVFRGSDLIQGEPDASSFPSAGKRSTFEARGYNAWDISSPAFIVKSAKGGTLCIKRPSEPTSLTFILEIS